MRRPLHEVDGAIRRLNPYYAITYRRGERAPDSGPMRWYEQRTFHLYARQPWRHRPIIDPRSPIWWKQLRVRLTDPIYDLLWHAGLIEVADGALWSSARLVLPWRTRRWPTRDVSLRAWVKAAFLRPTRSA